MRIAMIGCKGIPAALSFGGGVETHVEELSTRLAMRGHRVTVYVRSYANPQREKHWRGVRLVTFPSIALKGIDTWVHSLLSTMHALFGPYDIVQYHGVGPSTFSWLIRLCKPSAKVVVTFHSRDRFHTKWGMLGKMYLMFGEWTAVRFPHAIIAVSHEIQLFCRKRFHANAWHIPNGVNVPRISHGTEIIEELGLEPNKYWFTLSRLVSHKAIEDAIEAFHRIETDMKLVIIGDAPRGSAQYMRTLETLAKKDDRICLIGRRTGKELDQIISQAYAMVHPSRSEGLSVAVLEGMSYGKLVVMSDIPENLELVDHSGIAYPVGNVDALTRAMTWAISDPVLVEERGKRARETVKKLYSWESVIERTVALYAMLKKQ